MITLEARYSKFFHEKYPAVLVSPKLLRKNNCGQIDISYLEGDSLKVIEVKTSRYWGQKQHVRLKRSMVLLCDILGRKGMLRCVSSDKLLQRQKFKDIL